MWNMEKDPLNAHQACSTCKKNKRKCDKRLPACGLCVRTGRACEYDETPRPPPSADEFAALQARITELETRLGSVCGSFTSVSSATPTPTFRSPKTWTDPTLSSTRFPFAMFLDLDCYEWAGMKQPKPTATIPMVCNPFKEQLESGKPDQSGCAHDP